MTDTTVARKRGSKCVKSFILNDGSETARASGEVKEIKFFFPGLDETLVMNVKNLKPEILIAAAAFGISTSVSNTFGSADMSEGDALEAAQSRWETLEAGSWTAERETGPRTSLLIQAAKRVLERGGKVADADWEETFRARIADGTVTQKQLMAKPVFAAAYEEIRAELAEARRKAAAAKASEDGSDKDLSFLD